jgi:hypothetical protein
MDVLKLAIAHPPEVTWQAMKLINRKRPVKPAFPSGVLGCCDLVVNVTMRPRQQARRSVTWRLATNPEEEEEVLIHGNKPGISFG